MHDEYDSTMLLRRQRRRWSPRRMALVGLLSLAALAIAAVTANAATGGAKVRLADAPAGKASTGTGNVTTVPGPSGKPAGGTGDDSDDARMVDPSWSPSPHSSTTMPPVAFLTVDDRADPTFNQLLGINDAGLAVGYFGSGADAQHPNKGYRVSPGHGYTGFTNENFPGSVQTQVVGVDDTGLTVGFFVDGTGANAGFVRTDRGFVRVADPAGTASPGFDQLLGVNNQGVAAGFYNDAAGNSHGYLYQIRTGTFIPVMLPTPADSVVASGVNDRGDVSGFYTVGKVTRGFLLRQGRLTTISLGGRTNTQALGLNNADQLVGSFVDQAGAMHGFVWSNGNAQRIDDPKGSGGTVVNGLNNRGQLVGFYVDGAGNTNGFLARLRP